MPVSRDPAPFRPAMLAHAIEDTDFAGLDPRAFMAEWKWDGIRVQAVTGAGEDGRTVTRLYSRTGEDISKSFPDLAEALRRPGAIDGELLIVRDGRVQSFNVLQQRLNRKAVTPKLLLEFPAHLRAYDLLVDGTEDLRERPFAERRKRLQAFVERLDDPRVDLSPLVPFDSWAALTAARADPAAAGADADAGAVEGVMLKRRDAAYVPGRPKGLWWKWKRDPLIVDAVLMYAQRGHGKRSSYYSDYTFGVWTKGDNGDELVPVARPISVSPTRNCRRSTASCATTPSSGSARCARWRTMPTRAWCSRSRSRACSARRGTSPASPCGSPHQPAALGQAAARGGHSGDIGDTAGADRNRPR
jgi:DNA ligase-1